MAGTLHIALLIFQFTLSPSSPGKGAYEGKGSRGYLPPEVSSQVWSIEFEGNKSFKDAVLAGQISTDAPTFIEKLRFWKKNGYALNEVELRKDVIRIRNYYRRRSFLNVSVDYRIEEGSKSWKKHVIFIITENAPITIDEVSYSFSSDNDRLTDEIRQRSTFEEARKSHAYQPGRRYASIREPEVIGTFVEMLENMGHAFAKVDIQTNVDSVSLKADVSLVLDPGPKTYIDSIRVEGLNTMSKKYVVRESGLEKGELFSADKLQDAQQELFNYHLIRFVTVSIPDQPPDSTLNLLMRIRENALRSIETSVGFGSEEYLRGQVGWEHRNTFDKGHRFSADARASFIEQTASLDYLFPFIFNTKSSVVISPFGQHLLEKSFELLRGGITNSFIYRPKENLTGSATYQFTRNRELSKQTDASLPDSTVRYNLSSLQFSGYYSEGFSRQQTGWVIQPYAEISGFFGNATFSFQKLSLDVRRYFQLTQSTKLAVRAQAGSLFNARAASLPNNLRFFLGGTNSVRGWYRQELGPKKARVRIDSVRQPDGSYRDTTSFVEYFPVGGRSMFSFNLEVRQQMDNFIDGFGMAAFLDGGQIWRKVEKVGGRSIQFGLGGGLRYKSPIGPLRIDVAYKLNPTKKDLDIFGGHDFGNIWNRLAIHFSIGQAF